MQVISKTLKKIIFRLVLNTCLKLRNSKNDTKINFFTKKKMTMTACIKKILI